MDSDPFLTSAAATVVDFHGRPGIASNSGGWRAALTILVADVLERFAYYGISLNLITYLTGPMHQSTASAAAAVNAWFGVSQMLPLVGAVISDSYVGRFRMVVAASLLYVVGLGMLTLSVIPVFHSSTCKDTLDTPACLPSQFQVTFLYVSLYLVAIAQGGHKAAIQAFGADQFDQSDPEEFVSRSSLFNWWYFAICGGIVITLLTMTYVQDNIGWGVGFGIPCIAMVISLVTFLSGSKIYRYYLLRDKSQFTRIGKAFITIATSSRASNDKQPITAEETEAPLDHLMLSHPKPDDVHKVQVDEAKGVLQLLPIWATCLIYGVVFAQSSTFFTKQGSTMDRRIGPKLKVPPAVVQGFISSTIVIFMPIYERAFVPIARKFSKIPTGITMLQRIGTGILLSVMAMVVAALVEMKRLKTARDYGLVDLPNAVIPMSLWWLVPQYILFGISDVFTVVGLQEFFYDQMPNALKSIGLALFLSIIGIGSFLSSFLVAIIDKASSSFGESWFSNNLNRAHLDYFYWLLALLSSVELCIFFYLSHSYVYQNKATPVV